MTFRRALLTFSLTVGLVKVLGFLRGVIVAAFLGAQADLDVYYGLIVIIGFFVFVFGDQFEMLVAEEGSRKFREGPQETFIQYGREVTTVALLAGVGLTTALILFFPLLISWFMPELPSGSYGFGRVLNFVLIPITALYIPYRTMLALLKCSNRITESLIIDLIQSILFCAFTYAAFTIWRDSPRTVMVTVLAGSQVAAFLVAFAVGVVISLKNFGTLPLSRVSSNNFLGFLKRSATLAVVNYLLYLFTFIDRHFASIATIGGISLLAYASALSFTVRSLINYEQLYLIEFAKAQDRSAAYRKALTTCAMLSAPWVGFLIIFAPEVIRLVYQRGAFTAETTILAAQILLVYGAATTIFLWWQLCLRMLQVEGMLKKLFIVFAACVPLDIVIAMNAVNWGGVAGSIVGTVVVHAIFVAATGYFLAQKGIRIFNTHVLSVFTVGSALSIALALLCHRGMSAASSPFEVVLRSAIFFMVSGGLVFLWSKREHIPLFGRAGSA